MNRHSYDAYRDSGVEWLGEIPKHWRPLRLKIALSAPLQYGANETAELDDPLLPRYIRITDVSDTGTLREETFKSLPEEVAKPYLLEDGDLLFARSGATVGKTILFRAEWGRAAYAGYLIRARLNRQRIIPEFLAYFCQSRNYWEWLSSSFIQATIQNVSAERYAGLPIAVPPVDEQRCIAAFLDQQTKRIDGLIAKKERQIELLQEKRATLVTHAVTKGLNPSAKMKESGIAWLGPVPEHWSLVQLRRVVCQFVDYRGRTPEKTDSGVRLITAKNIKGGEIDFSLSEEYMSEDKYEAWMVRGWPVIGDVLVTTEAPLGEVAQISDPTIALAQRVILMKVNNSVMTNGYLKYHFMGGFGQGELWSRATGSTAIGIKADRLKETLVTTPPLTEQLGIIQFLDTQIDKIQRPLASIQNSIDKLREFRTALISAAVTGMIDVRGEGA